jgi:hypothetical protein
LVWIISDNNLSQLINNKRPFDELVTVEDIMSAIKDQVLPADRPAGLQDQYSLWDLLEACWRFIPLERPTAKVIVTLLKEVGETPMDV